MGKFIDTQHSKPDTKSESPLSFASLALKPKDMPSADLLRLTQNGAGEIEYELGFRYMKGREDLKKDHAKAISFFLKAARCKSLDASYRVWSLEYTIELIVLRGEDKGAYSEIFDLAQELSRTDQLSGPVVMGECYRHGIGTKLDYKMAFDWYNKQIPRMRNAEIAMAEMYRLGQYVEQSFEKAFQLYKRVHEGSALNWQALKGLAVCFALGQGTEKDLNKAWEYYMTLAKYYKDEVPESVQEMTKLNALDFLRQDVDVLGIREYAHVLRNLINAYPPEAEITDLWRLLAYHGDLVALEIVNDRGPTELKYSFNLCPVTSWVATDFLPDVVISSVINGIETTSQRFIGLRRRAAQEGMTLKQHANQTDESRLSIDHAKKCCIRAIEAFIPEILPDAQRLMHDPERWNIRLEKAEEDFYHSYHRRLIDLKTSVATVTLLGTIEDSLTLAHEFGHLFACDYSGNTVTLNMSEVQAFFVETVFYNWAIVNLEPVKRDALELAYLEKRIFYVLDFLTLSQILISDRKSIEESPSEEWLASVRKKITNLYGEAYADCIAIRDFFNKVEADPSKLARYQEFIHQHPTQYVIAMGLVRLAEKSDVQRRREIIQSIYRRDALSDILMVLKDCGITSVSALNNLVKDGLELMYDQAEKTLLKYADKG